MRVLLESTNSIPWVINWATKKFTYVGPQVERILGYPRQSWVDANVWAERIHPEDRDRVVNYCITQSENGEDHYADYRTITSDGSLVWIRDVVHVIREGTVTKEIVGFMFDITERKHAEEELAFAKKSLEQSNSALQKLNEDLKRSNQELYNFASIASHDLQEPLRKIISFGDLLRSRVPVSDEPSISYLERMQNAASRMRNLIHDLLQFAMIESEIKSFEITDLNKVGDNILDDLETLIKETEGTVNINNLPAIESDPSQMNQLFLNLIGNALKFHRDGIPPIVNLGSFKKENGFWEIFVEDNGIGIDEKYLDRVFKPFERLHGISSYEGTGIGLSICDKIVARHGGKITVKRQPTNGVTFHIILPEKQNHTSSY